MASDYAGHLIFNTKLDTDGFQKGTKKASGLGGRLTESLTKFVKRGAVAMGGAMLAAGAAGVKYNAQMEQYFGSFKTLLGSATKATEHMVMLKKFAAETPFEMSDLAQASQTLLAFGEDVNLVEGDLKMLGDISLGNKEKFSALALVFGQVKSQGKLMGQDLLQMINAGFNPLQIISKKTGKSVAELKGEMAKGQITFEMVADAMKTATSSGGQFNNAMKTQSKTALGLWSTLKDNVHQKLGEAMEGVSKIITRSLLPNAIKFVQKFNVKAITNDISKMITLLKIASPLIAGLYVAPRASSGISGVATLWKRGVVEAKKYRIEMAAISRLNLKGTKAEISAVGVAVGLLSGNLSFAEAKTLALKRAQTAMAAVNPYVAVTVGVLAFMAAIHLANESMKKHAIAADKGYSAVLNLAKANKEAEQSYNQEQRAAEKNMLQKSAEIQNAITLKKELDGIVDANGKVKSGYEGRAAAIVSVLQAQGVEIELQNGVIQNYGQLSSSIDKYLEKKRAEAVLSAYEESYKTAQKNIRESTEAYAKASKELDKHTKSQAEISKMSAAELSKYEERQRKLTNAKKDAARQVEKYNKDIMTYETLLAQVTQGNYSQIDSVLSNHAKTMEEINKKSKSQLRKQRDDTKVELEALKELYKSTGSAQVKAAVEAKEKELKAIDDKLGETNKKVKDNKGKLKKSTKDMLGGGQEAIDETELNMDEKLENLSNSPLNYSGTMGKAMKALVNAAKSNANASGLDSPMKSNLSKLSNSPHGYKGTISAAMRNLMNAAKSGASGVSFYGVGYNAGTGIKSGILAAKAQVIAAGIAIANAVVDNMKRAIESRSPSRKTARLVGAPIAQGVGVGMISESKALYKKARTVMNNTVKAMVPKGGIEIGFNLTANSARIPSIAAGTRLPVQTDLIYKSQLEDRKVLDRLIDKVEAISARPINQEINFHERVYTPGDARDKIAELGRIGLAVDV